MTLNSRRVVVLKGPVGTELWAPSCFKDVNSLSLTPGFVLYLPGVFNF